MGVKEDRRRGGRRHDGENGEGGGIWGRDRIREDAEAHGGGEGEREGKKDRRGRGGGWGERKGELRRGIEGDHEGGVGEVAGGKWRKVRTEEERGGGGAEGGGRGGGEEGRGRGEGGGREVGGE